jgi:hypothetical protein
MPAADVLVMGMLLRDWNLEAKRILLEKAYEALPSGGALMFTSISWTTSEERISPVF